MRFSPLLLMLLIPTANLTAQSATSAVFIAPPASQSCPVAFSAERRPNAGLREVVQGNEPSHGQGLQINFPSWLPSAIVKASITVHGASAAARMVPAASGMSSADSTEAFQLTPVADTPLQHSSIWTKKLNAISGIELTRVEYANGNVWQPTAESRCTAAPSLLVLVGAVAP